MIYTIGFTKKTAEEFFYLLEKHEIKKVIDIRLNNKSQLAGFAKGRDLQYFLRTICNIDYIHMIEFAPTKEILNNYKNKIIDWEEYERIYNDLIIQRGDVFKLTKHDVENACLLCSEVKADLCHRRLLAERIDSLLDTGITHI